MSSYEVGLKNSCLAPYYCSSEEVAYSKVACVALALLFLGAGIAVLSQQAILVPRLKFIMGGYLTGLSLFPGATFAVLHCCKKTDKKEPVKEIVLPLSKLCQEIIALPPDRVSNEQHPLLNIPNEVWKLIFAWGDPQTLHSRLSRLSISFFRHFCFKPTEMNAMGWHLGQLGKGCRIEKTLKERSFRSYFTTSTTHIKAIQVVGKDMYILEDQTYGENLSALMVWNMEQEAFTTHNLLDLHSEIRHFQIDEDLLYIMHRPMKPLKPHHYLPPYLTIDSGGIYPVNLPNRSVDSSKPWRFSIWNLKTNALVNEFLRDTGPFFKCYESLCIMEDWEQLVIYNKKDFTLLHILEGVNDYALNKNTLFFKGSPRRNVYEAKKYLGYIQLDKIPEHDPTKPISMYTAEKSATSPYSVLKWKLDPPEEFPLGTIGCLEIWNEKLLVGTTGEGVNEYPGELMMITLEEEDNFSKTLLYQSPTFQILLFGQTLLAETLTGFSRSLTILNLKRKDLWGSIECEGEITALEIFNGDSIVAGFEDGSVRMWSYSPE